MSDEFWSIHRSIRNTFCLHFSTAEVNCSLLNHPTLQGPVHSPGSRTSGPQQSLSCQYPTDWWMSVGRHQLGLTCCPASPPAWGRCGWWAPGCGLVSGPPADSVCSAAPGCGAPAAPPDDGCDARSCPVSLGDGRPDAAAAGSPPESAGGGLYLQEEEEEHEEKKPSITTNEQPRRHSPLFTSSLPPATASFSCSIFILQDMIFHFWEETAVSVR